MEDDVERWPLVEELVEEVFRRFTVGAASPDEHLKIRSRLARDNARRV
ncbi:MAG TPA: hypothetical protein VFJ56_02020 [Nitrospira sp.]|nr:hypothetical protein [Nitrospira sp.]